MSRFFANIFQRAAPAAVVLHPPALPFLTDADLKQGNEKFEAERQNSPPLSHHLLVANSRDWFHRASSSVDRDWWVAEKWAWFSSEQGKKKRCWCDESRYRWIIPGGGGLFCFFNLLSLWSVFPDFSWFPQYVGWDYRRSCCLAIKKILFYHKSCSIFLFPPSAVLHSFPDSHSCTLEFTNQPHSQPLFPFPTWLTGKRLVILMQSVGGWPGCPMKNRRFLFTSHISHSANKKGRIKSSLSL